MRQIHHWAALLFVAAIVVHMLRIFFTGAFRKPREINWIIGVAAGLLGLLEGFTGYSLPDDLLSGTGLRIAQRDHAVDPGDRHLGALRRSSAASSPASMIIGRLYIIHVLLIPAILLALIALHLAGPGQAEAHPVPRPGPHRAQRRRRADLPDVRGQGRRLLLRRLRRAARCSAASSRSTRSGCSARTTRRRSRPARQPDWYIGFLDGSTRLFPPGRSTCSARTRSRRCSGRRWSCPASCSRCSALYPFIEAQADQGHRVAPPAAAPARRAGAHRRSARWRSRSTCVLMHLRRQRRHRRQVRHQPERDDLGRPDRRCSSLPPIAYVRHLPHLPRPAAARPRGARARHRDRHHPAAADRRVHRGPPAARPGRRARPRRAGLRRRSGAQEDEPARRRPPGHPRLLHADRGARRRSSSSSAARAAVSPPARATASSRRPAVRPTAAVPQEPRD